jgi:hypothetical protein
MNTEPTIEELIGARAAMDDWDRRFWEPGRDLCENCMPPYLAAHLEHLRQERAAAIARGVPLGPVGQTGRMACVKCGASRQPFVAVKLAAMASPMERT